MVEPNCETDRPTVREIKDGSASDWEKQLQALIGFRRDVAKRLATFESDLLSDPLEKLDIAADRTDVYEELDAVDEFLEAWLDEAVDSVTCENVDADKRKVLLNAITEFSDEINRTLESEIWEEYVDIENAQSQVEHFKDLAQIIVSKDRRNSDLNTLRMPPKFEFSVTLIERIDNLGFNKNVTIYNDVIEAHRWARHLLFEDADKNQRRRRLWALVAMLAAGAWVFSDPGFQFSIPFTIAIFYSAFLGYVTGCCTSYLLARSFALRAYGERISEKNPDYIWFWPHYPGMLFRISSTERILGVAVGASVFTMISGVFYWIFLHL